MDKPMTTRRTCLALTEFVEKSGIPVAALIDIEEYKRFLAFQEINAAR